MRRIEIDCITREGQTSFIKPGGLPDINTMDLRVYYDGRKLPDGCYRVECDGALVVIDGAWPDGVELVISYVTE